MAAGAMEARGALFLIVAACALFVRVESISKCPDGWSQFILKTDSVDASSAEYKDYCYYYSAARMSTNAGEDYCRDNFDATLPSIHSDQENTFVYRVMCTGSAGRCHIGMRDDNGYRDGSVVAGYESVRSGTTWEGSKQYQLSGPPGWQWSDNTLRDFSYWSSGEPNNWRGLEDCSELWKNNGGGTWNVSALLLFSPPSLSAPPSFPPLPSLPPSPLSIPPLSLTPPLPPLPFAVLFFTPMVPFLLC